MNRWWVALAVAGWLGAENPAAGIGLKPGEAAPDLVMPVLNGTQTFTLSARRPHGLVLVQFINSWSVASHVVARGLLALYPDLHKKGVEYVMVGMPWGRETSQKMVKFAKQYRMEWPVGFDEDGSWMKKFNVVGTPTSCLVGRDGKVLWYGSGTVHEAEFQKLFEAGLAGRKPDLPRFVDPEKSGVTSTLRSAPLKISGRPEIPETQKEVRP